MSCGLRNPYFADSNKPLNGKGLCYGNKSLNCSTMKPLSDTASARWKRRNKEHVKQKLAEWTAKNKEHRLAYAKERYEKNREQVREYDYQRYRSPEYQAKREETKEERKKYNRDFAKKNRHIWREADSSRKASKRNGSSRQDRVAILEWYREINSKRSNSCFWCKTRISKGEHHFDHITPLAKGGTHTLDNLCVSCAPCNMSKHDKVLSKWNRELSEPVLL